jgi:hypothetical protein
MINYLSRNFYNELKNLFKKSYPEGVKKPELRLPVPALIKDLGV